MTRRQTSPLAPAALMAGGFHSTTLPPAAEPALRLADAAIDYRARTRSHRQLVQRAFDLGRALERVRMIRSYGLGGSDPIERDRGERLDARAAGEALGHLTRLALDVLPPEGYR